MHVYVFTFFQQCPATSSSSNLSSHWLFKLFLVNRKTQGECQSESLSVYHVAIIKFFSLVVCRFFHLFVWLSPREWFLNGNYLIIIVSALIILPLALMKQLGMFFILLSHFVLFLFPILSHVHHVYPLPIFVVFTLMPCTWIKESSLLKSFCNILSLQHRLLGLYKWLLPLLHGVFPNLGES